MQTKLKNSFSRRTFLLGAGTAAACILIAPSAWADIPFTQFAFKATGAPTARTMPDRLAEIKNVKDFGAVGNNIADDTAAIQAAVNWTSGPNRGTIYFPPGVYKTTLPITFNYNGAISIWFVGEGAASQIISSINGYIFDRTLGTPNNYDTSIGFYRMYVRNTHANGGVIRIGSARNTVIDNCELTGNICINTEDSPGVSSEQLYLRNTPLRNGGLNTGSIGLIGGGGGAIEGCDIRSIETGAKLYGNGWSINGGKGERCNTLFEFGLDSAGNNVGLNGLCVKAMTTEGHWTVFDFMGLVKAFSIEDVGNLTHDANNSGVVPGIKYGQYMFRFRADTIKGGIVSGCSSGGPVEQAAIWMDDQTNRSFVTFIGNNMTNGGGAGVEWEYGTKAHNAAFENNANAPPVWTFSQLPTGANVFESDEYPVSDSTSAAFGATVATGGGSNRVNLRWNSSFWTVC